MHFTTGKSYIWELQIVLIRTAPVASTPSLGVAAASVTTMSSMASTASLGS